MPAILGFVTFIIPFFPAFITLTAVSVPGVSLVPLPATLALLAIVSACALVGLIALIAAPREPVHMLVPLVVWLGAAFASLLAGFDPFAGILFMAIFGFSVLWHVTLVRFYRAPHVAVTTFRAYLLSGALASLAAVLMVFTKTPAAQYTVGHGRAIGTFILPGELAGYLIMYLPIAFAVAFVTKRVDLRWLAIAGLGCGGAAFALTFSRAGMMGFAAAAAFMVFTLSPRARRRTAVAILVAGFAAVAFIFNDHHNPSENFTRLSIWQAGLQMVQRFPLTGVGPFVFAKIYPLVRLPDGEPTAFHAHSFLLTIAAETGLLGVGAVLYAWWRFIAIFRRRLAVAAPAARMLALAVAAGLVGTWVQGLIDTVSVVIFGLWLPFMALALCSASDGLVE